MFWLRSVFWGGDHLMTWQNGAYMRRGTYCVLYGVPELLHSACGCLLLANSKNKAFSFERHMRLHMVFEINIVYFSICYVSFLRMRQVVGKGDAWWCSKFPMLQSLSDHISMYVSCIPQCEVSKMGGLLRPTKETKGKLTSSASMCPAISEYSE